MSICDAIALLSLLGIISTVSYVLTRILDREPEAKQSSQPPLFNGKGLE